MERKTDEILLALWIKHNGNNKETIEAIRNKELIEEDEFISLINSVNKEDYVTILEKEYPDMLKRKGMPQIVIRKDLLPHYEKAIQLFEEIDDIDFFDIDSIKDAQAEYENIIKEYKDKLSKSKKLLSLVQHCELENKL